MARVQLRTGQTNKKKYLLSFRVRQLDRIVTAGVRIVTRRLIRAQLDQKLPAVLVLLGQFLPDGHHVAMETDAGHLPKNPE